MNQHDSQSAIHKKVLLSGIKSTGRPHIGNYFGAMKQYLDMQGEHTDSRIFIADLHSLTSVQNGPELAESTLDLAIDYLAIGLDPKHVNIFKQSDLPEVAELAWIFNCITTMPYLMRAHAFKDAEAKNKEINVGVFDYPMLMAADILIHNADVVPVGKDQKQHVEFARDTAEKFNRIFCGDGKTYDEANAIFRLPEPVILSEVETVPGIDGRKMSKSHSNHIPLFSEDDEIRKLVMSIVTDSGADATSGDMAGIPTNVFGIHKLLIGNSALIAAGKEHLKDEESLKTFYRSTEGKYKPLKDALAEDLIAFITPLRARRAEIAKDKDAVRTLLAQNGAIMREKTHPLVHQVRKATGLIV
ncbi:MAG TPA: tryptophan--tRNA ligase [Candidatus Paceibacterota bacterium]